MSQFINCYAECHYAECHYAECHGQLFSVVRLNVAIPSAIILIAVMLNVMAPYIMALYK